MQQVNHRDGTLSGARYAALALALLVSPLIPTVALVAAVAAMALLAAGPPSSRVELVINWAVAVSAFGLSVLAVAAIPA